MSHKCIVCEKQSHCFLCSNGKVQEMTGMMCKKCDIDNMAWVKDTEEIGNGEGNGEWKMHQKKKPKNQIQNKNNNNKKKHHNQDVGGEKIGTETTSIMQKGSNYQDGERGRGGRGDTNQQHV